MTGRGGDAPVTRCDVTSGLSGSRILPYGPLIGSSPAQDTTVGGFAACRPVDAKAPPAYGRLAPPLVVLTLLLTAFAYWQRDALKRMLGPPHVLPKEAYSPKSSGPVFDHSALDALLRRHVDGDGWVDYEGLRGDAAKLDGYLTSLETAPFGELGRNEKLALLINAYNAFTLRLILDYYPVSSIKDIPAAQRWDRRRWRVGSSTWSLNQIEHEQIRPKFVDPRVHFALVCAAIGCPKLRDEAYQARRIEEQLDDQARYIHGSGRWFRFDRDERVVYLTRLYDWYGKDFKRTAESVTVFAARYSPALARALESGGKPRVKWLPYDWRLNDKRNAR